MVVPVLSGGNHQSSDRMSFSDRGSGQRLGLPPSDGCSVQGVNNPDIFVPLDRCLVSPSTASMDDMPCAAVADLMLCFPDQRKSSTYQMCEGTATMDVSAWLLVKKNVPPTIRSQDVS